MEPLVARLLFLSLLAERNFPTNFLNDSPILYFEWPEPRILKEREKKITCVRLNYNIFEKKKKIGETKNVKKFDDEK